MDNVKRQDRELRGLPLYLASVKQEPPAGINATQAPSASHNEVKRIQGVTLAVPYQPSGFPIMRRSPVSFIRKFSALDERAGMENERKRTEAGGDSGASSRCRTHLTCGTIAT